MTEHVLQKVARHPVHNRASRARAAVDPKTLSQKLQQTEGGGSASEGSPLWNPPHVPGCPIGPLNLG